MPYVFVQFTTNITKIDLITQEIKVLILKFLASGRTSFGDNMLFLLRGLILVLDIANLYTQCLL